MKEHVKYAFYTITHPFDGFYEIRHRQKGNIVLAVIFVLLFGISFSINRQYASFVVNDVQKSTINALLEVSVVLVVYFLFCVANWSITCLAGGVGRFRDITIIMGYAMLPLVLLFIPATLISQIIVQNEEAFYYFIIAGAVLWFVVMAIVGLMIIHNFSLPKTLISIVLTIVAMLVIMFLIILLISLMQQIYTFIMSIYNEIALRV